MWTSLLAPERESGGVTDGLRWIRDNAIIRAELLGVATLNLFNFIFHALFLLYATRTLGVAPATLGLVLGVAASGTLVASYLTGKVARRVGIGPAFIAGSFLFPAPLILVPAAGRASLARRNVSVHGGVRLRARPHVARHPRRDDHGGRDPHAAAVACVQEHSSS